MADEQVINQLKERVAFLEALVMSLVVKNESSATPLAVQADNNPSADQAATQANPHPAAEVQTGPATAARPPSGEVPYFMKLPPELRADILERVLKPAFATEPYGLIPPPQLPVTMYSSLTRLPAVLQVNQTVRAEGVALFFGLAQRRIAELETENKKTYPEYEALKQELEAQGVLEWSWNDTLSELGEKVTNNFAAMRELVQSCKALEGVYERKQALPSRCLVITSADAGHFSIVMGSTNICTGQESMELVYSIRQAVVNLPLEPSKTLIKNYTVL